MTASKFLLAAAALLSSLTISEIALAQWVSSTGSDLADCSRNSPCSSLQRAVDHYPNMIIRCVDSGEYGQLNILHSVTIDCSTVTATILSFGIGVAVTGNNVDVVLRGLSIVGFDPEDGRAGVVFSGSGSLTIENSSIDAHRLNEAGWGYGVLFKPNAGIAKLDISNTSFSGNGVNTIGGGIQIAPTGSASATVVINDTRLSGNTIGIRADSAQPANLIRIAISDTVSSNNRYHGFVAFGSVGPVHMALTDVVASGNADTGVRAAGSQAIISIGDSLVSGNGMGLNAVLGGKIESFGTNQIRRNGNNGITPELVSLR